MMVIGIIKNPTVARAVAPVIRFILPDRTGSFETATDEEVVAIEEWDKCCRISFSVKK